MRGVKAVFILFVLLFACGLLSQCAPAPRRKQTRSDSASPVRLAAPVAVILAEDESSADLFALLVELAWSASNLVVKVGASIGALSDAMPAFVGAAAIVTLILAGFGLWSLLNLRSLLAVSGLRDVVSGTRELFR
jgi:hypothetical protein